MWLRPRHRRSASERCTRPAADLVANNPFAAHLEIDGDVSGR
jgi:hypothetical protein